MQLGSPVISPALLPSASQECGMLEACLRLTSPCPYGSTSHSLVFIEQEPWFEHSGVGTTVKAKRKSRCSLVTSEEWLTFLEKMSRIRSQWPCLLGSPGAPGSTFALPVTKPCPWAATERQTAWSCLQELATECQEEESRRQKPGLLMWVLSQHIQREKGSAG